MKAPTLGALGFALAFAVSSAGAGTTFPESSVPELDRAAAALAGGELDRAAQGFESLAQDLSKPAFVRGLALFGSAEVALAAHRPAVALAVWERITQDPLLPRLHREIATTRLREVQRKEKGLLGDAVQEHRVELPVIPPAAVQLYVSPDGKDDSDGSSAHPFATLGRARQALREVKRANGGALPRGGARVVIRGGSYTVEQPFQLDTEDSGTAEAPVIYEGEPGQAAVFSGGRAIRNWEPLRDPAIRSRLDPAVRDRVLVADLRSNGISNWGDATDLKHRPELFADGRPQTLARWPNAGFVKTGEVLGKDPIKEGATTTGCRDGVFQFLEDRPKRWVDEADVRLYGYWFWDWYEEYQKVVTIDPEKRVFTLATPYSSYGYRRGQRYYALNVLRELDEPGEWYLDRSEGRLYWLPETTGGRLAQTVLSVCEQPFIVLENVRHVVLLNLTLQEGRGDGIRVRGGSDCLVAGCTLQRFGGDALVIQGGERHGVFGCFMRTLGCGGMRVDGGDRARLTAGEHWVENCRVSDISRLKRTYAPAVHLDGCGNRVAHNWFERIPSSAMRIEGNDHLIELNRVREVVQESDDQGGIDMFGNPLYRGVIIRWNRWSDIRGGTHCGAAAIRLDDMISGTAVYGNIFERCGAVLFGAVQIHGGKENLVDANVFVDCYAGISFSRWQEARWLKAIERFLEQAATEPYRTRYPDLAQLSSGADINYISRNALFGCPNAFLRDGGREVAVLNRTAELAVDLERVCVDPSRDARLRDLLFPPIPINDIGPYPHPWRAPGVGE